MQQVRTDYVLQVRNLLTMYYKLELTMYFYCLWYDKLWGPSQRVVTLFLTGRALVLLGTCSNFAAERVLGTE